MCKSKACVEVEIPSARGLAQAQGHRPLSHKKYQKRHAPVLADARGHIPYPISVSHQIVNSRVEK